MAIDWKKEKTLKNYCGYCLNDHTSSCDGSCFNRKDYTYEQICKNRKDHLEEKLKEIPELKKQLEQRESDLRNELELMS